MKTFAIKTVIIALWVCVTAGISPQTAWAENENSFMTVFKNGVYGGLAGALVGTAVLAFSENPGDHLDYIGKGAAIGVFAGVALGIVQATRSVAELENGEITVALPTPQFYFNPVPGESHPIGVNIGLLTWHFR